MNYPAMQYAIKETLRKAKEKLMRKLKKAKEKKKK